MPTYSAFQLANPLSRKKFFKKMLNVVALDVILGGFTGAIGTIIFSAFLQTGDVGLDVSIPDLVFVALIFIAVFIVIGAFYTKAYIKRYYYDAGENFLTIKKGVFAPTEIHVQYVKIQDVYVDQDIYDRMLGLYDVHIASATATSGIEAHIDGVEQSVAENIKNTLLGKITSGHSGGSMPQSASTVEPQTVMPVVLPGEISSQTYPPSSKYLVSKLIGQFFITLIVVIIALGKVVNELLPAYYILIFLGILAFQFIYFIIWFHNYSFVFDRGMIVIRTRVLSTSETHVPYQTIQDVVLNQGLIDRLFGIATITIQNATSQPQVGNARFMIGATLIGQPIDKAKELVEIVRGIIEKSRSTATGL